MMSDRVPAVILAEGFYGTGTAKTAHGLVRRSLRYAIVGVLDSTLAGRDAGEALDGQRRDIPILRDLDEALRAPAPPRALIVGVATFGGYLPGPFRPVVRRALEAGLDVVAGLHEHLGNDPEFVAIAHASGARLDDVRRPRPLRELQQFSDRARHLSCLRIPVLGTDGSIGKRTTAWMLVDALNARGVPAAFVATGQTGLLQGASYGVPLDSIPPDFLVGELEREVVRAAEEAKPRVVVIEGQGSISHPAYVCGTRAILTASQPQGLVVVHAPGRRTRNYRRDQLSLPMPSLERELELLRTFSGADVLALGLNHEGLTREEADRTAAEWEARHGVPACDPLWHGGDKIAAAVERRL